MNLCAIDPAGGSVSAIIPGAIPPENLTSEHERAVQVAFDMSQGFKYYRCRNPVIYNSAREAA